MQFQRKHRNATRVHTLAEGKVRSSIDAKDAQPGDVVYIDEEYGTIREVGVYFGSILEFYVEFADRFETVTSDEVEEIRRI